MLAPPPSPGKLAIRTAGNSATFYSQDDQPTATDVDGPQRLTYPALFRRLQLLQLRVDIQPGMLAHQLQQQGIGFIRPAITA